MAERPRLRTAVALLAGLGVSGFLGGCDTGVPEEAVKSFRRNDGGIDHTVDLLKLRGKNYKEDYIKELCPEKQYTVRKEGVTTYYVLRLAMEEHPARNRAPVWDHNH